MHIYDKTNIFVLWNIGTPLRMIVSPSICSTTNFTVSFFLNSPKILHCVNVQYFIHSSVDEHLRSFQFLPIINRALMKMDEQKSLHPDVESFVYVSKTNITGCSGTLTHRFIGNLYTDCSTYYTSLLSYQQ